MTCVLVQKVQNCLERISSTSNLINLGGSNILGYCAALVLRASLPNERNGSVTLGEEPNTTGSQLPRQSGFVKGVPACSLFFVQPHVYILGMGKKLSYFFSCLRELHQSQIGLHIHKKDCLWVGSIHAHKLVKT